jgi:NADH-ubiquinone oxidoreductase chain 1
LAEGESELVSGFNVEYGGVKFAIIFMAEYANILWMSIVLSVLFFFRKLVFLIFLGFVVLFLILRASYPRVRYDYLIKLIWKSSLSSILFFYLCFLVIRGV